ncbi:MAG: DNA/RNA non-specific endonuclease [Prevotella sp.]|nr:DNA/RNA non-specific endonuclease [Prevotella sp.]
MIFSSIIVLTNLAFITAFDTSARCPSWVYYDTSPSHIVVTNRMPHGFMTDPRVSESDNAIDYGRSGFDRGHMAPAADFNFSKAALSETYRFTNICPQLPTLNRGEWAQIEHEVRELAKKGEVHVLTFPEFSQGNTNLMGRVKIPNGFYKVAWGEFGVKIWHVKQDLE